MDNLPLIIGAVAFALLAVFIVRKVAALVLKLSVLGTLLAILAVLVYVYRDELPFLP